jgi:hypothetical protein
LEIAGVNVRALNWRYHRRSTKVDIYFVSQQPQAFLPRSQVLILWLLEYIPCGRRIFTAEMLTGDKDYGSYEQIAND